MELYAVVTGSNKGVGFEICKQLAAKGVMVVLTARDERKGQNAIEELKKLDLSDHVIFHQLDVKDSSSIAKLAEFVATHFGKLDILVNNAGILGAIQGDYFTNNAGKWSPDSELFWTALTQTYELGEECLQTNYYGAKRIIEAFIPLLQLSDSPRIVNISAMGGKLENIKNQWALNILSDVEKLTEEKIDEVLNEFLKGFKKGLVQEKGWPPYITAYVMSKVSMNAFTRILARRHSNFRVNCVDPGHVKTDMSFHTGTLTPEQGAEVPVKLALLSNDGPSGSYFVEGRESPF